MNELTKADKQQIVNQVVKSYRDFLKDFETHWQNYKTEADFPDLLKPFCQLSFINLYLDCCLCPLTNKQIKGTPKYIYRFDCHHEKTFIELNNQLNAFLLPMRGFNEGGTIKLKHILPDAKRLLKAFNSRLIWLIRRVKINEYEVI
jgi:hypothetical protein